MFRKLITTFLTSKQCNDNVDVLFEPLPNSITNYQFQHVLGSKCVDGLWAFK